MAITPQQTRFVDPYSHYHSSTINKLTSSMIPEGKGILQGLNPSYVDTSNISITAGKCLMDNVLIEILENKQISKSNTSISGNAGSNDLCVVIEYQYEVTYPPKVAKYDIILETDYDSTKHIKLCKFSMTSGNFNNDINIIGSNRDTGNLSESFDVFLRKDQNNIPDIDNTYDLGSASKKWKTVYAETVNASNLQGINLDTAKNLELSDNETTPYQKSFENVYISPEKTITATQNYIQLKTPISLSSMENGSVIEINVSIFQKNLNCYNYTFVIKKSSSGSISYIFKGLEPDWTDFVRCVGISVSNPLLGITIKTPAVGDTFSFMVNSIRIKGASASEPSLLVNYLDFSNWDVELVTATDDNSYVNLDNEFLDTYGFNNNVKVYESEILTGVDKTKLMKTDLDNIPDTDNTYDLGSTFKKWKTVYAETITTDNISGVDLDTAKHLKLSDNETTSYQKSFENVYISQSVETTNNTTDANLSEHYLVVKTPIRTDLLKAGTNFIMNISTSSIYETGSIISRQKYQITFVNTNSDLLYFITGLSSSQHEFYGPINIIDQNDNTIHNLGLVLGVGDEGYTLSLIVDHLEISCIDSTEPALSVDYLDPNNWDAYMEQVNNIPNPLDSANNNSYYLVITEASGFNTGITVGHSTDSLHWNGGYKYISINNPTGVASNGSIWFKYQD